MNVKELPHLGNEHFKAFSIQIDIEDRDQLRELIRVVSDMCNGHGLQLYDLLKEKCAMFKL